VARKKRVDAKENASAAAQARWAGVSKEERSKQAKENAAKFKLSPEDRELLTWLHSVRSKLVIIDEADTSLSAYSSGVESPGDPVMESAVSEMREYPETPAETRAVLDHCSICLSPIYDLDKPCETCVKAGRLAGTPPADEIEQIAEHQRARAAAPPNPVQETIYDVPRVSNSLAARAPIPAPISRHHDVSETCRSCGRLQELHQSHGGPLAHPFEAQA
jgi:hypothetical protein